jgi:hypothetical protein
MENHNNILTINGGLKAKIKAKAPMYAVSNTNDLIYIVLLPNLDI